MVCLIVFQAEKRQQMRQAGQRWTAFFGGESGFRGQQHHSLGITTGLVRRNNLLFIATLLRYRDLIGFTSLHLWPAWEITKGAFHLSELTGQTIPIAMRISLLIKLFSEISQMLNTVDSPSSGHCRDLKLVSSLLRVRYSESLFQAKRLKFIFACDFAAIHIFRVCVIAGCL